MHAPPHVCVRIGVGAFVCACVCMLAYAPISSTPEQGQVWEDATDVGALQAVPHAWPTTVDEVLRSNRDELLKHFNHQATCPAPASHVSCWSQLLLLRAAGF